MTSNVAAASVVRLTQILSCATKRRAPKKANNNAPASGIERTRKISNSVLLQAFQVMQIEAVELLPDLKKEDSQNKHGHQQIEGDPQLNDHGHSIGGAGS